MLCRYSDGGVLTAYHIVKNADEIWVTFATGQREKAEAEQSAMIVDIALLRLIAKWNPIFHWSRHVPRRRDSVCLPSVFLQLAAWIRAEIR